MIKKSLAAGAGAIGALGSFMKVKSMYDESQRQEARDKKFDEALKSKPGANNQTNDQASQPPQEEQKMPGFAGTQDAAPIEDASVVQAPAPLNPIEQANADSMAMADQFKAITSAGS